MKKVRVFGLMMCLMLLPIVALFAGCQADAEIKVREQNGYVQWSCRNNDWQNITTVDDIKIEQGGGLNEKQIELAIINDYIVWRYQGTDNEWHQLVSLRLLKERIDNASTQALEFNFSLNLPTAFKELDDYFANIMVNEYCFEIGKTGSNYKKTTECGSYIVMPTFKGKPANANSDISQYFLGWYVGTGINETKITSFTPLVNNNEIIVAKWDMEKINDEFVLYAKLTSRVDDTIYVEGGSVLSEVIELSGVNTIYWKTNSNNVTCPDNFMQVVSDKDGYLMFKFYDPVVPASIIATLQIGGTSYSENTNSVTATLYSQNNVAGDKLAGEIGFNVSNISSAGIFVRLKIECNIELEIKGLQSGWKLIDGYYYFGQGSSAGLLTKIYSDTRQDFCSGIYIPTTSNDQGSSTLRIILETVVVTEDDSTLIWNNSNN